MSNPNPYEASSLSPLPAFKGAAGRYVLAFYSFVMVGVAAFIVSFLCLLDDDGFQLVPYLNKTIGLMMVAAFALSMSLFAAGLTASISRANTAAKSTIIAAVTAIALIALVVFCFNFNWNR